MKNEITLFNEKEIIKQIYKIEKGLILAKQYNSLVKEDYDKRLISTQEYKWLLADEYILDKHIKRCEFFINVINRKDICYISREGEELSKLICGKELREFIENIPSFLLDTSNRFHRAIRYIQVLEEDIDYFYKKAISPILKICKIYDFLYSLNVKEEFGVY